MDPFKDPLHVSNFFPDLHYYTARHKDWISIRKYKNGEYKLQVEKKTIFRRITAVILKILTLGKFGRKRKGLEDVATILADELAKNNFSNKSLQWIIGFAQNCFRGYRKLPYDISINIYDSLWKNPRIRKPLLEHTPSPVGWKVPIEKKGAII